MLCPVRLEGAVNVIAEHLPAHAQDRQRETTRSSNPRGTYLAFPAVRLVA